mgnify:CR=1 FL=1
MGLYSLTEQEGFNKRVSRQWVVRKDIWGATAATGPPIVIDMTSSNYDDATINLDVSDASALYYYANGTIDGYFSNIAFALQGSGANDRTLATASKFNSGFQSIVVPYGFKYFNYRTSHTAGSTNRYIVMVRT